MSDNIKVGDLVQVIKPIPCCGSDKAIGRIFKVESFYKSNQCTICGERHSANTATYTNQNGDWLGHSTSRLKKIDPPAEGDTLPTRADLNMPMKEIV